MKLTWKMKLGIQLALASVALMTLHYLIFRDLHHLALYGLHEIAMMPLEVLVVTLILHSVLERREHEEKMHKLNMVIGAFFSEVGSELLKRITAMDACADVREDFLISGEWDASRFAEARKAAGTLAYEVHPSAGDFACMNDFMAEKRSFVLGMLQNPTLLEHETFTDMLWAVSHLSEELSFRGDFAALPGSDAAHLAGDIKRAYGALVAEWLAHAEHLQHSYPYLFALAVRTNPLDPKASATVTS